MNSAADAPPSSSAWGVVPLAQLCDLIGDGDWIELKDQGGTDYRLIQISNIGIGRFVETGNDRRVSQEAFDKLRCTEIEHGDVLVARMPEPTGRAWFVNHLPWRAITSVDVAIVRARPAELDPRFLSYFLNSPGCLARVEAFTVGTTRRRIRRAEIAALEVPVPPIAEQRGISDALGSLDDKIDVNRRMEETLEEIARTLFQSWFVDFDPVRGTSTVPEDVRRLFPNRLVDSPIGPVPEGWKVARFDHLVDNVRRQVDPRQVPPGTPHIGLEHMPRGRIALGEWGSAATLESGKSAYQAGDILFGKLRPYFHKVGVAPVDGICSTDTLVLRPRDPSWAALSLMVAASDAFVERADAASTGTRMPRASWKDMATFPVVVPPPAVCRSFQEAVGPMISLIIAGIHENQTLAELRDTLLPKLISGEIRLPAEVR